MGIKNLIYAKRECNICNSFKLESLWSYKHYSPTEKKTFIWNINNVRCKNCGFIFVSPVPSTKSLNLYYKHLHSIFLNQDADYSIKRRLSIINKYIGKKKLFLEIGGNSTDDFFFEIKKIFEKAISVEVNQDKKNSYQSINNVNKNNFDAIGAYFVLEHVGDPLKFLKDCDAKLAKNGRIIIEVPNVLEYEKKSDGLMFEHLNHFSPESLEMLASKAGLKKVFIGKKCSRSFGFIGVFEKQNILKVKLPKNIKEIMVKRDYEIFKKGVIKVKKFYNRINSLANIIDKNKGEILIWGANINTSILTSKHKFKNKITVVDSDPRKKSYLYDICKIKVVLPAEIKDQINDFKIIVIMTKRHAPQIIRSIKSNFGRKLTKNDILIIDI